MKQENQNGISIKKIVKNLKYQICRVTDFNNLSFPIIYRNRSYKRKSERKSKQTNISFKWIIILFPFRL